ncbi:hypothetical protein VY88_10255 [Azospirillum thiophilum]|uniref:Uncharacterized protein n=1 Tax=Azospirillum thiophilum TaxID=528244 RepID=A0AAC8ZT78_9PROT|nr:hypothetical protein [Azospirillum thiophilum]ALG69970.1 hypothetical protein AL072_02455 [Azospirillum thiophilum]KJR66343.1 hypothetical protein VY88_10255 [Azospirillum thiophilum]
MLHPDLLDSAIVDPTRPAPVRHRPGSLADDALTVLRHPHVLGAWLHADRLAELLASASGSHRAGKATAQIANELRAKLLTPARKRPYPDIEVQPGSLIRAVALSGAGAPTTVAGLPCPLSRHEHLQGLLASVHLLLGDAVYLPPGDRGRHPGLRSRLTLPALGQAAVERSLAQIDGVVLRGGRLHRLYEIETDAGKATKALVRLNDVLAAAGAPDGGSVVAVPDAQLDRLRLELQRPTLQALRGVCRSLPFSARREPLRPLTTSAGTGNSVTTVPWRLPSRRAPWQDNSIWPGDGAVPYRIEIIPDHTGLYRSKPYRTGSSAVRIALLLPL